MRGTSADDAHSVQDAGEWGTHYDTVSSIRECRLSDGKVLRRSVRAYARAAGTAGDTGTSEGPSSLASETHAHTRARSWPTCVSMCPSCPRRLAKCGDGHRPQRHPPPTSHAPALPRTPPLDVPLACPPLPSTHLRPALHPPPTSSQVASSAHSRSPVRVPYVCMRRDANITLLRTHSVSVSTRSGVLTHRPRTPARRPHTSLAGAHAHRSVLIVVAAIRIAHRGIVVVAAAPIAHALRGRRHPHTSHVHHATGTVISSSSRGQDPLTFSC